MPKSAEERVDGERLLALRTAMGLSQREMSVQLGVGKSAVAFWERGRPIPGSVARLIELFEQELGLADPRDNPPGGRLTRTREQALATLSVAILDRLIAYDQPAGRLGRWARQAVARRLGRSLGQLKGFGMKVAQALHGFTFALPEDVRVHVESINVSAPAMSRSTAARIFLDEVGQTPRQHFAAWESRPFAVASIGQVHRAKLSSGKYVAVKIQHPGMAETLAADLDLLSAVDQMARLLFRRQQPHVLAAAVRSQLLSECDYRREAHNQERFATAFAADRSVLIPRVHRDHSSARVLTTDFVDGKPLADWSAGASAKDKAALGRTVMRFILRSIFELGCLLNDPHPGNFFVIGRKLVIVDFGRVFNFEPTFVAGWRRLLRAVVNGKRAEVDQLLIDWRVAGADFDFAAGYRMLRVLFEPWLEDRPFTFDVDFLRREWQALLAANPNRFSMNLSASMASLHELHFGWFGLLARLSARANWHRLLLPYLE